MDEESKKLVDETLMNQGVDQYVQQMINKPQIDPTGIDDTDMEFMEKVIKMVESEIIHLYVPSSLINEPVYKKLDEQTQGRVDLNAVNLLSEIRQIKTLWDAGDRDSFQIQNLIYRMRHTKQIIEKEIGDCFII